MRPGRKVFDQQGFEKLLSSDGKLAEQEIKTLPWKQSHHSH